MALVSPTTVSGKLAGSMTVGSSQMSPTSVKVTS